MNFEQSIEGPVAVIGDLHGQTDKLNSILDRLRKREDFQSRWIIFIGDLVDRGPDPRGVIQQVLLLIEEHPRTIVISGNHELAMSGALQLFDTLEEHDWSGRWLDHYGSESTFASYGVEFGKLDELRSTMPEAHRDLLQNVPWAVEHPDYFFVHSGLDPHSSFEVQRRILVARDFMLRRPGWLCSKRFPFENPPDDCCQTVVSGHARVEQVVFARNRILVDTTGGYDGSLSCVLLPEQQVICSDPAMARQPIWEPTKSIREIVGCR